MDTAAVLLKPDTVIDALEDRIIEDIETSTGLRVIWKRYWQLSESDTRTIYPLSTGKPIFRFMLGNLIQGPSMILLVQGNEPLNVLNGTKGTNVPGSGLRLRYRQCTQEELDQRVNDLEFIYKLKSENRIHVPDTSEEAALLCSLCVTPSDKITIQKLCPEFYKLIEEQSFCST
jgi:nucleoside diphosphate kinase